MQRLPKRGWREARPRTGGREGGAHPGWRGRGDPRAGTLEESRRAGSRTLGRLGL